MKMTKTLSTLALTAFLAGGLTSAAFAEMGGMSGAGMMPLERFDDIDTDKDGKMTKVEIEAYMAARATEADADKDGKLSAEELVAMHEKAETARKAARATMMITKMDGDGDGFLTPAEMTAAPGPAKMFARIDADSDGAISRAEAEDMQAKMMEHRQKGGHKGHKQGGFFGWMHDDN
jgi:Ca2+-binding EF-hand superfamily protein